MPIKEPAGELDPRRHRALPPAAGERGLGKKRPSAPWATVIRRREADRAPGSPRPAVGLGAALASARMGLRHAAARRQPANLAVAAMWDWDLASNRMEWDRGLEQVFGHAVRVSDPGWREDLIHPDERARVVLSLQKSTIAGPGSLWSERYRLRLADGRYVPVTELAFVIQDAAGPVRVLGAIMPEAETEAAEAARP